MMSNDLAKEFKKIEDMGYNPTTLKEHLKIEHKLETMEHAELMNDGDYHLWRAFEEHWNKKPQ
ncbi:hypothetical protein PHMEG_00012717 [Phytophthora megakarya]|uniref:Avirulence (Avh) protein n=1 Tax=Phytophthora megakarya TaxID=4795 RepID=A0A225W824_9STRA|nr:hypothetical protein PHMEG_00012717 [Phytophthora megakarya]